MNDVLENNDFIELASGVKLYRKNPSVSKVKLKCRPVKKADDNKSFFLDGTRDEFIDNQTAVFTDYQVVDQAKFIKIYTHAIKDLNALSKSANVILYFVMEQLSVNKGMDEVKISPHEFDLASPTYYRALRELLDKEVLFRSTFTGVYFVNVDYIFNGDRIAFVQAFQRETRENTMNRLTSE